MIAPDMDGCSHQSLADLDCERGLLGNLILGPDLIARAIAVGLAPENFASPGHAGAFAAMMRLGRDPILARPCSAIVEELRRAGDLALSGGPAAVATFLLEAMEPSLVPQAIERLLVLARARRVQAALREALARLERDPAGSRDVLAGIGRAA